MDTHQVIMALRKRFNDKRRYAIAEEVGLTTGYARRRLDMIVADCYNSNGYRLDGFELKVSTADLRRELADPDKHVAFFEVIDYYTLVCPSKVVEPVLDIIPKKWGILIVNDDGTTRYKRRPLALKDESPNEGFQEVFLHPSFGLSRNLSHHSRKWMPNMKGESRMARRTSGAVTVTICAVCRRKRKNWMSTQSC